MAKKRQKTTRFSIQSYDAAHYRHTEQYTKAVEALFDRATAEVSKAAAKGAYNPDKPFSFDDYPSVKSVMQDVTTQLASRMVTVIETGSKKQWLFACDKNDGFIESIMDTSKISKARLRKMQDRNLEALQTFQQRKVEGMNLSQRVWKYVGQYKDQLESALDVGLGEGRSADQLSRDVRQSLKDPNRLFRRVRDKRGNLVLSKNARAFHPGQGVYRSSYKNAMRLTRSEINMAYRESDFIRWQSLDFVVGFEICRSNHEPLCKCDLCEKLKGRYPKTFKFKGWHPQCMCYAIPILMDEETFDANELGDLKAALRGTQYKQLQAKNLVSDVPDNFKQWVKDHEDAQKNWGSTPYFIKDNFKDGKLSEGLIIHQTKTLLQLADERHKARTQSEIDTIKDKWLQRVRGNAESLLNDVIKGGFNKLGVDISALKNAISGTDVENIQAQMKYLISSVESKKTEVLKYANDVLNKAKEWKEIDTTTLSNLMRGDDFFAIHSEAESLSVKIETLEYTVAELGVYIPDVKGWRTQFTMDELEATKTGVERTLGKMPTELEARKDKLVFEIGWVEKHKKYPTWKVAQSAYKKELESVERKIEEKKIADRAMGALFLATTSRSSDFKALADEVRAIISKPGFDLDLATKKVDALIRKKEEIEKRRKQSIKDATIGSSQTVTPESLADLKKRLGDDLPKTLPGLESAISKYERSRKYGDTAKKYKAEIEDLMRKVFDTHDYGMNIDEDVIEQVLSSWFKNTFEVGGGNGYVGSRKTTGKIDSGHLRLGAAHRLFGLPTKDLQQDQLARADYEKYGNLLDHDIKSSLKNGTATQYGRVEVRFNKKKVIATWTAGDSLGEKWQPSLCSDPRSCSFDDYYGTPTSRAIDVTDLAKFKRNHISHYLELQYHGNLTIDCVESLAFPYDLMKRPREYAIAQKWKNYGVKVYYIGDDGELKQL